MTNYDWKHDYLDTVYEEMARLVVDRNYWRKVAEWALSRNWYDRDEYGADYPEMSDVREHYADEFESRLAAAEQAVRDAKD